MKNLSEINFKNWCQYTATRIELKEICSIKANHKYNNNVTSSNLKLKSKIRKKQQVL